MASETPSPAPARPPIPDSAGEPRLQRATIAPWRVAALHAALGRDGPPPAEGEPLPPMWHSPFFPDLAGPAELGKDGDPRPGGFLPDTGLPRRMRAGGRLEAFAPIPVGAEVERVSVLQNVAIKQGGSGTLAIITVRHELFLGETLALREEEDLVHRPAWTPGDPPRGEAPRKDERPAFRREIATDPVLLFRYSALAFNGHRIHYDHPYATKIEGFPERVVQGPMMAQILADLLRDETGRRPRTFEYRAVSPAFCGQVLTACGRTLGAKADLWLLDPEGRLVMEARVLA
ncbi:hypothetical protein P2H44_15785 [Albimonas sp. CAU 1670]|uniref:hypothetical protein n=1 Tax=Albimonas sp. CAU 1670 TaxID=3032599 RepID=UPI0023DAC658|nr:hypothetical protein [Albimonas sp. CAU 1670]MDF2234021.1 hypothetical protein [Albimonas sp. CAU 1670]